MIMYMVNWFSYKMRYMHFCGTLRVAITSISQLIKTARDGRSQTEFAQVLLVLNFRKNLAFLVGVGVF